MDPQTNQPPQPGGNMQDDQPPLPPRPQPDWQQGLGAAPTPSSTVTPSMPGPQPLPPIGPVQGNMPAAQPSANQFSPGGATVPTPNAGQPMGQPMMMPAPASKKKQRIVLVLLVILGVAAIGAASYFIFFKSNSANEAAKKSSSSSETKATDLSTLNKVTLTIATPEGYTESTTSVATAKQYTSTDGNCSLVVGTATATELPGADLNAIVQPELEQLRKLGATISGPNAGTALALKNSASSSTKYSMPTLNFEFAQNEKHATVHYSAVILKSGDRAVVNRTCGNKTGEVDKAKMTALDNLAKNIVVTKQQ